MPNAQPIPESATPTEAPALFDRLRGALLEDLSTSGDVTSRALIPEDKTAEGIFLAKAEGVVCGVKLLGLIFQMAEQLVSSQAAGRAWDLDDAQAAARAGTKAWDDVQHMRDKVEREQVQVTPARKDGERILKGDTLAHVRGNARAILAGERVALNLLSHLSGVASQTATWVSKIAHTRAKLLDTRKTTPLWRDLEKYAVKCGGGENHRRGLFDMILIKDNHLALWGARDPAGAVNAAHARFPDLQIEVEVTDLAGLQHVCAHAAPEMILLDNFTREDLRAAVAWTTEFFSGRKDFERRPLLEASGGVSLETLVAIAETGVDRISAGTLTHSVKSLDVSLELKI